MRLLLPEGLQIGQILFSAQGLLVHDELFAAQIIYGDISIPAILFTGPGLFPVDSAERGDDINSHRWNTQLNHLIGLLEIFGGQADRAEAECFQGSDDPLGV